MSLGALIAKYQSDQLNLVAKAASEKGLQAKAEIQTHFSLTEANKFLARLHFSPGPANKAVDGNLTGHLNWNTLKGDVAGRVEARDMVPWIRRLIVENLNPRTDAMPARVDACQAGSGRGGATGGRGGRGGPMGNEVYRSEDGGRSWKKLHGDDIDVAGAKAPYSFNQIRTNPVTRRRSSSRATRCTSRAHRRGLRRRRRHG